MAESKKEKGQAKKIPFDTLAQTFRQWKLGWTKENNKTYKVSGFNILMTCQCQGIGVSERLQNFSSSLNGKMADLPF